jgi:hypothetical protein
LIECKNHIKLAETLVAGWLKNYMFKSDKKPRDKAKKLARYLANDKNFLSHGRRVDLNMLRNKGVVIDRIEDLSSDLRSAVERVHLAVMATLDQTAAVKLFENSLGAVLIRMMQASVAPIQEPQK